MKEFSISLAFIFTFFGNNAQDNIDIQQGHSTHQIYSEYLQQILFDKTVKFKDIDLENLNYTGSPYENDNFLAGKIHFKNKLVAENVPLRYNVFFDEMEFKPSFSPPDEEARALMKSNEVVVHIGIKKFVFMPYQGGIENGGYFEMLSRGERVDLLKKYNKTFRPEQKSQSAYSRSIPARFSDNTIYYIVLQDGRFIELDSRAKRFTDSFIGMEKEIADFIKEKRLDIKNEDHIIQIVNHYNTL
jgi:hypothetical protein